MTSEESGLLSPFLTTQSELPVARWNFRAGLMSTLLIPPFPLVCCYLVTSEDPGQFLSTIKIILLQEALFSSFIPGALKT